jgi:hypothetical protein
MRLPAVACDVVKLSATRESQEFVSSRIGPVVVYTSRRFTRESARSRSALLLQWLGRPASLCALALTLLSYSQEPEYLVGGTLRQMPAWIKFK